MIDNENKIDVFWDDNPVDVTSDANFIWSIANKLRGSFMPDKYGDVIIPMTIIRRFECALENTKNEVIEIYEKNPLYPDKAFYKITGYQFFNTSRFTLAELCNDADHIYDNFKAYIKSFSSNVVDILSELEVLKHVEKMDKDGCLYNVVKAFSELDLSIEKFDSIKMGYIFENLIGRFFQNVDAGQYYTGRDIIKMLTSVLISEGCEDIFEEGKVITVCDQACGTGGMLSTAYSYLKHHNPSADIRLFGQEYMGQSYAVGLAEMLIKGQNTDNFRHTDTFKEDCFKGQKMRFVLENPPFGTPWGGKDAKEGQEEAVLKEYDNGPNSRWGAGLPGTSDGQMLFLQSAIDKMDEKVGRAAIIENGSPLSNGSTASGESQIRRWMLENDLIEAIIQMPTEFFYNTGISTYAWILSKNKKAERKGKIQLIDASTICHKLRKAIGEKKYEFTAEDRMIITKLYTDFKENEYVKIFDNTEFIYKEYAVMQPMQRSYSITKKSIHSMIQAGSLSSLWDEGTVYALENPTIKEEKESKKKGAKKEKTAEEIQKEKEKNLAKKAKDQAKLKKYYETKPIYDKIISILNNNLSEKKWLSYDEFSPVIKELLDGVEIDKKLLDKIADGLSVMDKNAVIQTVKTGKSKGETIYDKASKDSEIVPWNENIEDYMEREVLPYIPDAKWFWEEDLNKKNPIIRVGAEIPFTRYFYKYQKMESSKSLADDFIALEDNVSEHIQKLFAKEN